MATLKKILFQPIAQLGSAHAQRQLETYRQSLRDVPRVQADLLKGLLAFHRDTRFGKDYGLANVRTMEEFKRAVPISDYETFRPYIDDELNGIRGGLIPADEPLLMFSMTSGTTGEPKFIPVTGRFIRDIRRGWNAMGINFLNHSKDAWMRPILQLSSAMCERKSPSGLPCGAISGLLARTQKKIVRMYYVSPLWVSDLSDPTDRFYCALRHSIHRDVAIITTANPSATLKLIQTGQDHFERLMKDLTDGTCTPPNGSSLPNGVRLPKRGKLARRLQAAVAQDGQLLPRHFWNVSFLTNWTGGTLKLYLPRLEELFDHPSIYDIGLLASEGRFSIPLQPGAPGSAVEILSNVLEFIPADQHDAENPETLAPHELTVDEEYFLVFSNYSGLMRYNLDDRIRVLGFQDQAPLIEFLSRGLHTASITGEKITECQVVEAMHQAREHTHLPDERFILQGRFADTPYYELRVWTEQDDAAEQLARLMDKELRDLNIEYDAKRQSGRLGPIRPIRLARQDMDTAEAEAIASRRGRTEQYKHQYLRTDVLPEETA